MVLYLCTQFYGHMDVSSPISVGTRDPTGPQQGGPYPLLCSDGRITLTGFQDARRSHIQVVSDLRYL